MRSVTFPSYWFSVLHFEPKFINRWKTHERCRSRILINLYFWRLPYLNSSKNYRFNIEIEHFNPLWIDTSDWTFFIRWEVKQTIIVNKYDLKYSDIWYWFWLIGMPFLIFWHLMAAKIGYTKFLRKKRFDAPAFN